MGVNEILIINGQTPPAAWILVYYSLVGICIALEMPNMKSSQLSFGKYHQIQLLPCNCQYSQIIIVCNIWSFTLSIYVASTGTVNAQYQLIASCPIAVIRTIHHTRSRVFAQNLLCWPTAARISSCRVYTLLARGHHNMGILAALLAFCRGNHLSIVYLHNKGHRNLEFVCLNK